MLTWAAHAGAVTSVAFVPGGGLLSTGTDGVLKHWDAATGAEHFRWKLADAVDPAHQSDLLRVLADAAGRYAVVGVRTRGVLFFDLEGVASGDYPLTRLAAVAPAPGGGTVFCGGTGAGGTRVWEVRVPTGEVVAATAPGAGGGTGGGLAVSPDGTRLLAGVSRYSWPDGARIDPPVPSLTGTQFAVSADGDKLFGANHTRLVVWGFQTGALRRRLKGHVDAIRGLTATPDGRKLWTAAADATVRQWDVETYRCERCYGLKVGPLGCVAVSPDGLTAAAGSAHNGHLAVWDLD